MAGVGIQFFATREDMEEVIGVVEAQRPLTYVRTGLFDDPAVDAVDSLLAITELGFAPAGKAAQCPRYLVGARPFVPVIRSVLQRRGGTKYSIDQLENQQTITIRPGGVFESYAVIAGTLDSVSKAPASLELYRLFMAAVRPRFQAIKSYRIGKNAAHLMDAGYRMTADVRSPTVYDLTRD
jgi:hypothetical protein